MEDPFSILEKQCQISTSQERKLLHCPFALHDSFPPPSSTSDWPEFSSSSADIPTGGVGITFLSPPETPLPSDELFTTPPESVSASSDDADLKRKRKKEDFDTEIIEGIDDNENEITGNLKLNEEEEKGSKLKEMVELMRKVVERSKDEEKKVDLFETAKRCGMTFPRSRCLDFDGLLKPTFITTNGLRALSGLRKNSDRFCHLYQFPICMVGYLGLRIWG